MPLIPLVDIDDALGEIERVVQLGFRGLSIPMSVPDPYPYFSRRYDQIWAAAQGHGLTLFAHIGTGIRRSGIDPVLTKYPARTSAKSDPGHPEHMEAVIDQRTRSGLVEGHVSFTADGAQDAIVALVSGGALERFPRLHFIMVEVGARWLQNVMDAMDDNWYMGPGVVMWNRRQFGPDGPYKMHDTDEYALQWPYPLAPSEYVRRQIHVTFMDDWRALRNRSVTGIEPLIWGNDYPHPEGCWPCSQEAIAAQVERAGLTEEERTAIFGGTLAGLLGL
jgi:predicted TIM-barrel fold metal-dependent hydrolase